MDLIRWNVMIFFHCRLLMLFMRERSCNSIRVSLEAQAELF